MGNILVNLQPAALWKHFEAICGIPHPSKFEAQLRDYVVNWSKALSLETIVDEVGNVIIRKPATKGMEDRKGIVLQAHLDMVPQKNNDTNHDFEKDPIIPWIDGEWVKAKGTTLGADNGIGMAAAMAVLEAKDLVHGPIEALFTIDEETGMTGAFGIKAGQLKGDILMNLDSEDEGELYVGCAGGTNATLKFRFSEEPVPPESEAYKVSVMGLKADIQVLILSWKEVTQIKYSTGYYGTATIFSICAFLLLKEDRCAMPSRANRMQLQPSQKTRPQNSGNLLKVSGIM
jgi:dipeptidase D